MKRVITPFQLVPCCPDEKTKTKGNRQQLRAHAEIFSRSSCPPGGARRPLEPSAPAPVKLHEASTALQCTYTNTARKF